MVLRLEQKWLKDFNTSSGAGMKRSHSTDVSGVRDWKQEKAVGDYSPGRYSWLLNEPVQFETPTPAKGKLSIWEYDESLLPS